MADGYGEGATGKDLNRNRQYPDVKGSTQGNAQGAVDISGSFSKFAPGRLGETITNPDPWGASKNARVDIANPAFQNNPPNYQPNSAYPFQSLGEPGLIGQDKDDYGPDPRAVGDDPQRPNLPNLSLTGAGGTTNAGPQGDQVMWDAVGPYEYAEFPKDPSPTLSDPTKSAGQ